jgi:hypothetical protein
MPWSLSYRSSLLHHIRWLWRMSITVQVYLEGNLDSTSEHLNEQVFWLMVESTRYSTIPASFQEILGSVEVSFNVPRENVGSFWELEQAEEIAATLLAGKEVLVSEVVAETLELRDRFLEKHLRYMAWLAKGGVELLEEYVECAASSDPETRESDDVSEGCVMSQLLRLVMIEDLVKAEFPEMTARIDAVIDTILDHPGRYSYTKQCVEGALYCENPRALGERVNTVIDRLMTLPDFEGRIVRDLSNLPAE